MIEVKVSVHRWDTVLFQFQALKLKVKCMYKHIATNLVFKNDTDQMLNHTMDKLQNTWSVMHIGDHYLTYRETLLFCIEAQHHVTFPLQLATIRYQLLWLERD